MARLRITVDIDGIAEVIELLHRAAKALRPPVITDAVLDGAKRYQDGARARAPVDTARLRGSIQATSTGPYSAKTWTDLIYAPVQEFGAVIRPVHAQALRFVVAGGIVFAQKVTIPPQPYFIPTFNQDTDRVVEHVADRIMQHIGF